MDEHDAELVFDDEEASDQHSDEGGEGVEDQEEEEDEDEEAAAVPHKKARAPVPWIEVEKTTAVEAEKW